jgi:hypothetical protein
LQASKRIYEEAQPIYWKENLFCFDDVPLFLEIIRNFSRRVRASIQQISVGHGTRPTLSRKERQRREALEAHFAAKPRCTFCILKKETVGLRRERGSMGLKLEKLELKFERVDRAFASWSLPAIPVRDCLQAARRKLEKRIPGYTGDYTEHWTV